jgi:hypothetical protein
MRVVQGDFFCPAALVFLAFPCFQGKAKKPGKTKKRRHWQKKTKSAPIKKNRCASHTTQNEKSKKTKKQRLRHSAKNLNEQ